MNENPGIIEEERAKRNLLADQPAEVLEEVPEYYEEGVEAGIFESGRRAAKRSRKGDFEFYVDAGQLKGPADEPEGRGFLGPRARSRRRRRTSVVDRAASKRRRSPSRRAPPLAA